MHNLLRKQCGIMGVVFFVKVTFIAGDSGRLKCSWTRCCVFKVVFAFRLNTFANYLPHFLILSEVTELCPSVISAPLHHYGAYFLQCHYVIAVHGGRNT